MAMSASKPIEDTPSRKETVGTASMYTGPQEEMPGAPSVQVSSSQEFAPPNTLLSNTANEDIESSPLLDDLP